MEETEGEKTTFLERIALANVVSVADRALRLNLGFAGFIRKGGFESRFSAAVHHFIGPGFIVLTDHARFILHFLSERQTVSSATCPILPRGLTVAASGQGRNDGKQENS